MKKLFMVLGFLILLMSSLSARYIFDDNIVFTSHATAKDSIVYFCIEKAGGVIDTFMTIDTLGNITIIGSLTADKIQSGFFFQELLSYEGEYQTAASGDSRTFLSGGFTTFSSDSFTIDSLLFLWWTDHNDVYIDSVYMAMGMTRTTYSVTLLWGDGTNYGVGTATFIPVTYAVDITVSFDWRLRFQFYVATSATAGNGRVYSVKAYCHY